MQHGTTRTVVLAGSTGSIGTQACEVITAHPDRFEVVGLTAGGGNPACVADQAVTFRVPRVAVGTEAAATAVRSAIAAHPEARGFSPDIAAGPDAVAEIAGCGADVVLNGITGAAGLATTLAALDAGSTLALANKESLVMAGDVVITACGGPERVLDRIVPVDSEHSALAQCWRGGTRAEVARLVLTASGGPFRGRSRAELADVTPDEALNHPTWNMGPMVTINSAQMMNKALEVIEAHLLFAIPYERIDVAVHPQSVVHSMVEFCDGSTLAQVSPPDMRLPIALGLSWPERLEHVTPACDWRTAATWEFFPPDEDTFPATRIAREVGGVGGTFPAVFNAANETAVAAFCARQIGFLRIMEVVERVVADHDEVACARRRGDNDVTTTAILAADAWARERAQELICGA